jgi:hypothetical protein
MKRVGHVASIGTREMHTILMEKLKGRDHLVDPTIRIILKWI